MAIDFMDGAVFPRDSDLATGPVSVVVADNSFKKHKDDTVAQDRVMKAKPSKAKTKKKAEEMNRSVNDIEALR